MKKKVIISQNFNAWVPVNKKITQSNKIALFSEHIRNKFPNLAEVAAICLQEIIGGRNGRFLEELQIAFPEFIVLTPPGFDHIKHYKSLLCVILIHREIGYKFIRLESCLPNRICCVKVWFDDSPSPLRILNMYAVQTAKFSAGTAARYIALRKEQKEDLWAAILNEAKSCTEPLLICGDLQEDTKTGIHIKKLVDLGFFEKNGGFLPTVRNDFFEAQNLDHFFFNQAAWQSIHPVSLEYDPTLLDLVSDHILLAAAVSA